MLTGKRYELRKATVVLHTQDGRRVALQIPAGSEIKVVSGPKGGDGLVDILWNGKVATMFQVDIEERGNEIPEKPFSQDASRVSPSGDE